MLDKDLSNYTDWRVRNVKQIKKGYGFVVVLIYPDGSKCEQQWSGYSGRRDAENARNEMIGALCSGTYLVFRNVLVSEFMEYWLEHGFGPHARSSETLNSYRGIVKNHIIPELGGKRMADITTADVQELYNRKLKYSESVTRLLRTVLNVSFRYAVSMKVITSNPADKAVLPRTRRKAVYNSRTIEGKKTLSADQVLLLIEKSRGTRIYLMVLLNVLMGLRRSEIIGLKYSDIDHSNRTIHVARQLGRVVNTHRDDFAAKTYTKQEIGLKTRSSDRVLPIPDMVYEAIMEERSRYEANRSRRKASFQDLDYICCSSYGRPRSRYYHQKDFKRLLVECGLPDIRWHDLRATYCTMLLKKNFSMKAVSKLMGHSKEIVTVDVYGDNRELIVDGVPELEAYIKEVIPKKHIRGKTDLSDFVIDISGYLKE